MRILFASSLSLALLASAPSLASELKLTLAPPSAAGFVTIEEIVAGPPESLVVEWTDVSCGAHRDLELLVNDVPFTIDAPCAAGKRAFVVDDAAGIAAAWRDDGPNALRLVRRGRDGAIVRARVRAGAGLASASTRLFDIGEGSLRGAFEVSAVLAAGPSATPRLSVPFASSLPSSVDISGLSDGPHALCVVSGETTDCVTFLHDGESTLTMNGGDPGTVPIANAGLPSTTECASAAGALVTLDGTASTGDIVQYQWYENYGTGTQTLIGTGTQIPVTLSLGVHTITLKVTDPGGQFSTANTVKTVADTTAPVVRLTTNPKLLWPADHRMVDVGATLSVQEVCGSASIVLMSVTSNEPDDAAGDTDGNTTGDIQGVTAGT
ncbi:MAG TPA: hypothetical protein VJ826_00680, partial [Candidatus Polarisedimenticolaceae bacterium]|nr:hypothetical protein [Candidatus Polarisedimenticolaceae bacterium]